MNGLQKGLLLAGLHAALVLGVGGKFLLDRAARPRVWVKAAPVDPDLPIRGRYVLLRVEGPVIGHPATQAERLAFFIPEHVTDPSRRGPGEELWAEVTVPKKGPLRPIRLGVRKNGVLTPLDL